MEFECDIEKVWVTKRMGACKGGAWTWSDESQDFVHGYQRAWITCFLVGHHEYSYYPRFADLDHLLEAMLGEGLLRVVHD